MRYDYPHRPSTTPLGIRIFIVAAFVLGALVFVRQAWNLYAFQQNRGITIVRGESHGSR